jgi:hypothetical protein
MHVCMNLCIYVCKCVYVCMYVSMYEFMYLCTYVCTYLRIMYLCMYVILCSSDCKNTPHSTSTLDMKSAETHVWFLIKIIWIKKEALRGKYAVGKIHL